MNNISAIKIWLLTGLLMVFMQVVIGGITRLTESGLSITKWEVVTGTLPPLSEESWNNEFELYKKTPQYLEINEGMSMKQFKFIYFWEYIHRLWARIMGFVFIIPFIYFYRKGLLTAKLKKDLGIVVILASLAAAFGWIMVASGLVERPWVNAYKLSIHLLLAFSVFGYLFWTYLNYVYDKIGIDRTFVSLRNVLFLFFAVFVLQLFLGGMMSGMKIAVVYPTWPDMNGVLIPGIIMSLKEWNWENFYHYDTNEFTPAIIHFFHRNTAYLLLIVFLWISYKFFRIQKEYTLRNSYFLSYVLLVSGLVLQIILGISTVLLSIGKVPVFIGVAHQAGALLLLAATIYFIFVINRKVH
ncbi:MAG: COX15/CtaA family protein [Saprospiraceae bacterium]|nr:COX15/CtaA family protein [Saprospiraceae bacterium]